MKKLLLFLGCIAVGVVLGPGAPAAKAIKPFQAEFIAKYLQEDTDNPEKKAYIELVRGAKCNICHQGKKKEVRNPYGVKLADLLDKKADKDNKEKIQAALTKVGAMKSDPKNEKSKTFGELIASGKLPGGKPKGPIGQGRRGGAVGR